MTVWRPTARREVRNVLAVSGLFAHCELFSFNDLSEEYGLISVRSLVLVDGFAAKRIYISVIICTVIVDYSD